MELRRDFLLAVYTFAEGGKAAALKDALANIQPTAEEMQWILATYQAPRETQQAASANIPTFIAAFTKLLDDIQTGADSATSIVPVDYDDSRGDVGMRTRSRKELGMAQDKDERHPERSAGQILLEQLYKEGWRTLTPFARKMHRSESPKAAFFHEIKKLAATHGLENGICEFMRGKLNHTMLSPALMELCEQELYSPQPLPMQPGERISSLFQDEFFTHLIREIKKQMEQEKTPLEHALVTRKKGAKNPTCLTTEFQSVLQEMGIITIDPENVNRRVRIHSKKIPRSPRHIEQQAKEICTRLRGKIAEKEEVFPSTIAGEVINAVSPPDIGYDGLGLA